MNSPNKIKLAEKVAALVDFVSSHTVKNDNGTIVAPRNVQN